MLGVCNRSTRLLNIGNVAVADLHAFVAVSLTFLKQLGDVVLPVLADRSVARVALRVQLLDVREVANADLGDGCGVTDFLRELADGREVEITILADADLTASAALFGGRDVAVAGLVAFSRISEPALSGVDDVANAVLNLADAVVIPRLHDVCIVI